MVKIHSLYDDPVGLRIWREFGEKKIEDDKIPWETANEITKSTCDEESDD